MFFAMRQGLMTSKNSLPGKPRFWRNVQQYRAIF